MLIASTPLFLLLLHIYFSLMQSLSPLLYSTLLFASLQSTILPYRESMMKVMLRYTPSLSLERADLLVAEILSDLTTHCPRENARYTDSYEVVMNRPSHPEKGSSSDAATEANIAGNATISTRSDFGDSSRIHGSQPSSSNRTEPVLTKDAWCNYMASWLQVRNRERCTLREIGRAREREKQRERERNRERERKRETERDRERQRMR